MTAHKPVPEDFKAYLKKPPSTGQRSIWIAAAAGTLALAGLGYWFTHRAIEVSTVHPVLATITETIASSGLVGGVKESVIGASFSGPVLQLLAKLGDQVEAGQTLAILKNTITQAQVVQAETTVATAQAQFRQTSRGPLPSELQASQMQVTEARATAEQATSDLALARKTQARTQALAKSLLVSRSELEAANAAATAAEAKLRAATASIRLAEAQLQTLRATPRKEDVDLARDRVTESGQALRVARQQAGEATIVAPYSGTITAVNVEAGQNVDALGLFAIVSDALEIRVDLDESNLADLSLGQKALLTAQAFPDETFAGTLKEISPAVNKVRGTVSIKLTPANPPAWLKTGQTLNVNLVTGQAASRLLVPTTAVRRSGEHTVVLVAHDGIAYEKIVVTRPPTEKGIPILAGVEASDDVIVDPAKVQAGSAVRIK